VFLSFIVTLYDKL